MSVDRIEVVLEAGCERFVEWLDGVGYASYDPYDLWGTRYGLWSRKVYYAKGMLGIPWVAPLVAVDILCPSLRRLFVEKDRFATCDAQLLLAFLNLFHITGEKKHLDRAVVLGDEILEYSIPGYRGPCWGYPFDWQNNKDEVWPKDTPYITCTPYCYEAFLGLLEATGEVRYRNLAAQIAEFIFGDLKNLPSGPNSAAGSYSPYDTRQVVNATAYRAYILADAGRRFGRDDYLRDSRLNLNFVLESQAENGSWLYAMSEPKSFIDNFHTCFNLKNLIKLNRIVPDERVAESIRRGYKYYRSDLIDVKGNPKSFAVEPRLQLATLEMYNFAEGITLGSLLADEVPSARKLATDLAGKLIHNYQLADGHFVTRVFRGGFRHKFPFMRWPQGQLFYSLTNLWRHLHIGELAANRQNLNSIRNE